MSAVCPSCGVTVVAGYRRCPKCHAALPYGGGRRAGITVDPGGTALPDRSRPLVPILSALAGAVLIVVIAIVVFGGSSKSEPPAEAAPSEATATVPAPQAAAPAQAPVATETPATRTPDPGAAAAGLERALRRQRLWSTVEVTGARVDVRSSACSEAALGSVIDARRDVLRDAGLTRLRCLEQSGRVVFERDL